MYEDLKGKSVLITRAASGIGKAFTRSFSSEGARLMLLDCDDGNGERLAGALPDASYRHCDVSREEATARRATGQTRLHREERLASRLSLLDVWLEVAQGQRSS